jgi:hypothetical protein
LYDTGAWVGPARYGIHIEESIKEMTRQRKELALSAHASTGY